MSAPVPPIAAAGPRRTGLLVAAVVTLGVGFFGIEHNLFVSRLEMYGTTTDDLEASAAGGNLAHQLGFSLVALLGVIFLARAGGRAWRLNGPLPVVMVSFVACCAVSCLWATDGPRTFKRAGILVLCLTGTLGLGRQLTARQLCLLALAVSGAYAALGLGAELALGTFKPGGPDYRFAGTLHPNGAGANAALLCLSACCLLATGQRGRLGLLALLAFGGALLVVTKSRSACAALLLALLAVRLLRPSSRLVICFFVAAWAACGLILLAALARTDPAEGPLDFLLLGRAEHAGTLTGRTELWAELIPYARERFLLGYGYGSFWSVDRIDEISNTVYWGLSSSHSVYLETLLGVGAVGLSLIGLTVLTGLGRAGRLYRTGGSAGHALTFGLLVYGLINGVAESDFISPSFMGFMTACGLAHLGFFRDEDPERPGAPYPVPSTENRVPSTEYWVLGSRYALCPSASLGRGRPSAKGVAPMTEAPDVTVVVCTYNRAELLRDTLDSLMGLKTGGCFRYEILVVDNASTDETPAVITAAAGRAPVPLRGVREARPGVACARNRGVREARGEWVAFFDDDQVADPHWLVELLALTRERGARCVGGANRLRLPGGRSDDELHPACRALLGGNVSPPAPRRYTRKAAPGAGNLLVQRRVFAEVGLFDEGLRDAGEDGDLYRRLWAAGVPAWQTPRAVMYHVIPAYRLEEGYLRWKALRNGGHVARRSWRERGRLAFAGLLAARLGQVVAVHLPRLLWARLRRDREGTLGARCLLWRAQGYVRYGLSFLAPRLFAQRAFFNWLEFRAERELFPVPAPGEGLS